MWLGDLGNIDLPTPGSSLGQIGDGRTAERGSVFLGPFFRADQIWTREKLRLGPTIRCVVRYLDSCPVLEFQRGVWSAGPVGKYEEVEEVGTRSDRGE